MVSLQGDEYDFKSPRRRWSRSIICFTVVTVLLVIVIIVLLTLTIIYGRRSSKVQNICITKDCIVTASTLIKAMEPTVDPCVDFYQFTCGGYIRNHPVPDHEYSTSTFLQYKDFYSRQLRDMIESIYAFNEPDIIARTQEAYHVCLNATYQPTKELNAFKSFVNNSLGGWPLAVGSSWKPVWTLEEFLGKMQRLGFSFGFGEFSITTDFMNRTNKKILFSSGRVEDDSLRIRRKFSVNDNPDLKDESTVIYKAYFAFITAIAKILQNNNAKISSQAMFNIIKLEGIVGELDKEEEEDYDYPDEDGAEEERSEELEYKSSEEEDEEEEEDDMNYVMTLDQMNEIANGTVDWLKVINIQFENIHSFSGEDKIYADSTYVTKVSKFLGERSYRNIANFVIWKIILNLVRHAGTEIEALQENFIKSTMSRDSYQLSKSWEKCVDWIQEAYKFPIARLFVKEFVDPEGREKTIEMIELIRKSYMHRISQSPWVDQITKDKAIIKANSMKKYVSYPDFIFDDKMLEDYYNYLPIVKGIHFDNVVDAKINSSLKQLKSFKDPVDLYEWDFNPLLINAFYAPDSNSIWFPVGILQLPFFDETRPAAVNYGMIGTTIGHEMGHGFDNDGRRYDEIGQEKNWWTRTTLRNYLDRTKCFEEQYDNYCPEELQGENETEICVDGQNTLGENLADLTGVKAAYEGYKRWVGEHGEEKRLPGLEEYTAEQIFFISYGYIWCENLPADNWVPVYSEDEHSPSKYRVIGVLSNMDDFAKAFNCPVGTMNRGTDKCQLW